MCAVSADSIMVNQNVARLFAGGTLLFAVNGAVLPDISRQHIGIEDRSCVDTQQVLSAYMAAVGRGELVMFGVVLAPEDITPIRVELSLDINSGVTSKTVYSELNTPFPCPRNREFLVRGVTATLTDDNGIGETAAHLYPR